MKLNDLPVKELLSLVKIPTVFGRALVDFYGIYQRAKNTTKTVTEGIFTKTKQTISEFRPTRYFLSKD